MPELSSPVSTAVAAAATSPPLVVPPAPSPAPGLAPAPAPATSNGAIEIERGRSAGNAIALTFDCGGTANGTAEILAALREADVSVTFFMIGDWVRAHPELAREIAARHEFASHSNTHPDYRDLTDAQIASDLEAAERAFIEVTGKTSRPLWRAPSAARDDRVLAAAAAAGWPLHIFWTFGRDALGPITGDSGDWTQISAQQVADNMRRAGMLGNGAILVAHCDSAQTRAVLPTILREWRAAGIRVTTVSEVLR